MKIKFSRYVPSPNRNAYTRVMNQRGVQADMLRRAENVAQEAYEIAMFKGASRLFDSTYTADVQPGIHRASARATFHPMRYATGQRGFYKERGLNIKLTNSLQEAINAAGR